MSDYKMSIEKVDNGYLLEFPNVYETYEDGAGITTTGREVIAEDESQWGNLEAGLLLIFRLMEFFDLTGSKHDERRLQVSISGPGDEVS
jgi:hypothetical protein